jgi:NAD(P)-dependent dehydrogenase (short-subunit alcohol dehydrogenase family)
VNGIKALVTGGASGIGRAAAELLMERGALVAVLDRDVSDVPAGAFAVAADVTDDAAVRSAVSAAVEHLGGLDVLVNNAGIGAAGDVTANSDSEWHHVFDVNVVGLARVARAALPHLRASSNAAIVNTCSVAGLVGLPNRALYGATKGAVYALTLGMATDHLPDGIRVNAIAPGTVDTPWVGRLLAAADDPTAERAALEARQPIKRLVSAREVAEAIYYLASPSSGSTTGTVLPIDGGLVTLKPRT